jgi:hypothetical protein
LPQRLIYGIFAANDKAVVACRNELRPFKGEKTLHLQASIATIVPIQAVRPENPRDQVRAQGDVLRHST